MDDPELEGGVEKKRDDSADKGLPGEDGGMGPNLWCRSNIGLDNGWS